MDTTPSLAALSDEGKRSYSMIGAKATILIVSFSIITAWSSSRAFACKIKPSPDEFPIGSTTAGSPQALDALNSVDVAVTRSKHAPPGTGDCAEVGRIKMTVQLSNASTWPSDRGVRLRFFSGLIPSGFQIPAYPMVVTEGALDFSGSDDPSQAIAFTLQAAVVDSSGNESAPIDVHITSPGSNGSGCSFVYGDVRQNAGWAIFFGLLFLGSSLLLKHSRNRCGK